MEQEKRIVIIGGVAGGASAAARVRRLSETAKILLVERGEHISFANCGMPYHIGETIRERNRLLVQTHQGMQQRYHIDIRTKTEAVRIDRTTRHVVLRDLATNIETAENYDALILSPGAEPVRPAIPGVDSQLVYTLRNLADMDRIKKAVDARLSEHAVVVGGGYIGLEMAEALRQRGMEVTLIELAPQVFIAADPEMVAPIQQQLVLHGVKLRLNSSVTSIEQVNQRLLVRLSNGESVEYGFMVLAVGVRPEVKLAREAGLEIGPTGGIVVDDHMRTCDSDIFAIGDAAEVRHLVSGKKVVIPLAGPANRQGRIAADNILGRDSVYHDSQGTAICKVFDLAIAMTGLSEKNLKTAGLSYEKVYVHPASHAGYYPGASQISLKLLFHRENGKILGAQAVGADGVDKRIDVLAVGIRAGLTVEQMKDMELCYAPPYGSAKDPINYACFVAGNVLSGDMPVCHFEEMVHPTEDQYLLDVRTPEEVTLGTIPGAKNIPLDDLRQKLSELPRNKEILVFCQVGLRGYLACRTLLQNNFRCRNLTGGYKTYKAAMDMISETETDTMSKDMTDDTGQMGSTAKTSICCETNTQTTPTRVVKEIDACGLQCPGPIMKLRTELDTIGQGEAVSIVAADPGFPRDVAAWCESMGHRLLDLKPVNGACRATIMKLDQMAAATAPTPTANMAISSRKKSIILFSGDFDKAMAAFVIANGAAAMGSQVTMFFTFWGLNVLRKPQSVTVQKNLVERMFGWMMPRGADKLALSKMNMGGMGLHMIKGIMRKKNVSSLPQLIESARQAGVRLVACAMSMDLMGIHKEELIDGIEEGGVAMYLGNAETGTVNLFI